MLAAGSGSRFEADLEEPASSGTGGDAGGAERPLKQYEKLGGRRLVDWSTEAARSVSEGVVLVVPADRAGEPEEGVDAVVAGGATRAASVRAGLNAVPGDAEVVVVHDSARPMASPALFWEVIARVRAGAEAAIPGLALTDTVKRVGDGAVVETLDRSELVAAQTPQAFRADVLRSAHDTSGASGLDATDDAALVEALGRRVVVVPGEAANVKITRSEDLTRARMLLPWTFSTFSTFVADQSADDAEVS